MGNGQGHSCYFFPTKWVDVNKGDAKQPAYRSRLCGKELKRWDPTMPGTFASMGLFECVMFLFSKALMWKPGASGPSARKIMFLDASIAHCQADATSEMAIELPPEGQVKDQDLVGELLKSLYGAKNTSNNWEKKWQSRYRLLSCPRFVDSFMVMTLPSLENQCSWRWTESRLNEKLIFKRKAILGPDDDDKTVTILNRLATWVRQSESRNQIEKGTDPRHREILLAQMNLDGANTKSVATPAMKVQERIPQMRPKLDKDRASLFRSATMRASQMSSIV